MTTMQQELESFATEITLGAPASYEVVTFSGLIHDTDTACFIVKDGKGITSSSDYKSVEVRTVPSNVKKAYPQLTTAE